MLLVARVLVHFVSMNISRISGPSIVKLFSIVVNEITPLNNLTFYKFLGSAMGLLHLKNYPFGIVVASAPQIETFSSRLVFLCMLLNRPFIVLLAP